MPSSTSKLLTRKKKAVRRGSKTFRHKKNLRQNISVKKQYTKDKRIGKKFTRVARGLVDDLRNMVIEAKQLEETDIIKDILDKTIRKIELEEREIENDIRDTECPVCQEEMTEDEATKLNCGHKFHTTCLINYLIKGNHSNSYTCPLCRGPIFSDGVGDYIKNLLSGSPENGLMVARAVLAEVLAAREAAVAAMQDNIEAKDAAVYIASMAVELARARMDMKSARTEEESVEVVRAAGARIDAMRRMEEARRAARRAMAARQEAMAKEMAAMTEATRARIVNAARARRDAERAAVARQDEPAARYEASRAAASNHRTLTWQELLSAANSSTRG